MIKSKYYLIINLSLASIGIYFSYFYFGEKSFFYSIYNFSDILKYGFLLCISIIFVYVVIHVLIQNLIKSKLPLIFEALIFSLIIYLTYHFLIRFSDLSYYEIYRNIFSDKNPITQIIFYFYPFFISLIFFFNINIEIKNKISKFLLIVLIIINSLSIYRIFQIYINNDYSLKNDYVTYNKENRINSSFKKKVIFLVFDEFDQKYYEKYSDKLTNLKELELTSYSNNNFYTPANYTRESIPAILTGNSIRKVIIKNKELSFINLDNNKVDLNFENSIFNDFTKRNLTSSIYAGYYIPYCRIFKVKNCYDRIDFQNTSFGLKDAFNFFLEVTFFEKILDKVLSLDKEYLDPLSTNNLAEFMVNNSENFINTNTNLVYIHYSIPPLPIQGNNLILDIADSDNFTEYEKNLFLVDLTIKKIQSTLSLYKDSLLIVTSDHWFRQSSFENYSNTKPYPVFFASKIIGDNNNISENDSKNSSSLKKLIIDYLDGNVNNNNDIALFFQNEKNHETYVRHFSD